MDHGMLTLPSHRSCVMKSFIRVEEMTQAAERSSIQFAIITVLKFAHLCKQSLLTQLKQDSSL